MEATKAYCNPAPVDPLKLYRSEISKYRVLLQEEEFEVARLVYEKDDQGATQRLIVSNLRLVVKIALEYYSMYTNVLDLIQEGNVGLIHAVKKYNPYRGTKFSTYAAFWIRGYILKHLMDCWSMVKIGTTQNQRRLFFRLTREKRKLEQQGFLPTQKLLAGTINMPEQEIANMQVRLKFIDTSLDVPVREGDDDTLLDEIESDCDVEEIVIRKEKSAILSRSISDLKGSLSYRESFIFDHRIMTDEPMTLKELGSRFRISRERVRKIESKVILRLKNHAGSDETVYKSVADAGRERIDPFKQRARSQATRI